MSIFSSCHQRNTAMLYEEYIQVPLCLTLVSTTAMYMLDDGGAWSTGFTRVAVLIVHGLSKQATSVKPSRPQARNRLTNLYDDIRDKTDYFERRSF